MAVKNQNFTIVQNCCYSPTSISDMSLKNMTLVLSSCLRLSINRKQRILMMNGRSSSKAPSRMANSSGSVTTSLKNICSKVVDVLQQQRVVASSVDKSSPTRIVPRFQNALTTEIPVHRSMAWHFLNHSQYDRSVAYGFLQMVRSSIYSFFQHRYK